jgi:hypothetical protein
MYDSWEIWEICKKNLVGILEGKRTLGRLRLRWDDNIRIDVREIVLVFMD